MAEPVSALRIWIWRHPKPIGAAGRCIGRTDLPVDPRRAKRLAHRIRQHARRHHLPHAVVTSPLRRLRERVEAVLAEDRPALAVGHAGWINALRTRHTERLCAADWPAPLKYATLMCP